MSDNAPKEHQTEAINNRQVNEFQIKNIREMLTDLEQRIQQIKEEELSLKQLAEDLRELEGRATEWQQPSVTKTQRQYYQDLELMQRIGREVMTIQARAIFEKIRKLIEKVNKYPELIMTKVQLDDLRSSWAAYPGRRNFKIDMEFLRQVEKKLD